MATQALCQDREQAAYRRGFEAARDAAAKVADQFRSSGNPSVKYGASIIAEHIRALVPGDTHGR